MAKVIIRAYGGTGALIARALIQAMVVNPVPGSRNGNTYEIHLMDYDQPIANGRANADNDYQRIRSVMNAYNTMHQFGLECIAVPNITLDAVHTSLRAARENTFGTLINYSVEEIYAEPGITIMQSLLTKEQWEAANANGCYADLARNAMLAHPMRARGAFNHSLLQNGDVVFYVGSTDGGTANTMLDYDMMALVEMQTNLTPDRGYRVYSVRTMPYKGIPDAADPNDTDLTDAQKEENKARAKKNNDELIPKAVGVIRNMDSKPSYVYKQGVTGAADSYYLDGVVLIGSPVQNVHDLKPTDYEPYYRPDRQLHKNHPTELGAALAVIDLLWEPLQRPTGMNQAAVLGYNDDSQGPIALSDNQVTTSGNRQMKQIDRVKSFLSVCTVLGCHMLPGMRTAYQTFQLIYTHQRFNDKSIYEEYEMNAVPEDRVLLGMLFNVYKEVGVFNKTNEYDIMYDPAMKAKAIGANLNPDVLKGMIDMMEDFLQSAKDFGYLLAEAGDGMFRTTAEMMRDMSYANNSYYGNDLNGLFTISVPGQNPDMYRNVMNAVTAHEQYLCSLYAGVTVNGVGLNNQEQDRIRGKEMACKLIDMLFQMF